MKCPHCGKKLPLAHRGPSPKERAFAAHWLTNGNNGREAARSAGYTGKDTSLDNTASRLIRRAQVQVLIENARLPDTELVLQVLREVALAPDESQARVAASRVLARIKGMIAPTQHQHAHLHAVLELPAAGTQERTDTTLRAIRAALRTLGAPERARLLDELAGSGAVPALPEQAECATVRTDGHATGEAGEGGEVRLGGGPERPS